MSDAEPISDEKCTCGFADMSPKEWFGVPPGAVKHAHTCPRFTEELDELRRQLADEDDESGWAWFGSTLNPLIARLDAAESKLAAAEQRIRELEAEHGA